MATSAADIADRRPIGLPTAVALVVASMIGVGVFTTLSFQAHALPSAFVILLLWTVGGLVALAGALCYAELVTALPRSGGEYHLLGRLYGPGFGLVAGVVSLLAGFAAPIAAAAIAFAAYAGKLSPLAAAWPTLVAALAVVALCLLHCLPVRIGGGAQTALTALKVALIVAFLWAGWPLLAAPAQPLTPAEGDLGLIVGPAFAVSLVYVNYAYLGWNAAVYTAAETRDPTRTLPRALIVGTLLVTVLYLALNAVFLAALPREELLAVDPFAGGDAALVRHELAVGFLAGKVLFGEVGAAVVGGLVAFGLLSTISAMVMIGPRVAATMAEDLPALRWLRAEPGRAPVRAVLTLGTLALLLLLSGGFAQVLAYIGITLSLCALAVAFGVFWMRWREPDLPRPFRCPGYPLTPLVFLLADGWMVWHVAFAEPAAAAGAALTVGLGIALHWRYKVRQ